jgi:predicted membrane protein
MNTDHLTLRALSFAMAAVLTASMLAGIDSLATNQHAGNELMAQTPAASMPRG